MPKLSESLHLGLFADDLPAMVAFYRDTLGFETDWDGGPFARFAVGDGGLFSDYSLFMSVFLRLDSKKQPQY